MSVETDRPSSPSYLYTPEQLRRIKKRRCRKPTSLRKWVLDKNAHNTGDIKTIKMIRRRRQRAANKAREKANLSAVWEAQKTQSLNESLQASPTRSDSSSELPPLTKVNWLSSSHFHRKRSETDEQDKEDKENDESERFANTMPELEIQHIEGDVVGVATDHSVIVRKSASTFISCCLLLKAWLLWPCPHPRRWPMSI